DVTSRGERARGRLLRLLFLLSAVSPIAVAVARSSGLGRRRSRGLLLVWHSHRECGGRAMNLAALQLQQPQQFGPPAGPRIIARKNIGGGPRRLRLQNRILALGVKIAQEIFAVGREMRERDEQSGLLIVVVVALRPPGFRKRRVLFLSGGRIFWRRERGVHRVPAPVVDRLV